MKTRLRTGVVRAGISFVVILLWGICAWGPPLATAQAVMDWVITEGYFCTLYMKPDVNIERLNRKIDTYGVDFGLTVKPVYQGSGPEEELSYKFDLIFLKVQEILDMRPPQIRVDVKIYRTREEVYTVYAEIFNETGELVAFYMFTINTLFACAERISAPLIAHEMAHCIVDHHFKVPPPEKIAEMIAHYAQLNLRH